MSCADAHWKDSALDPVPAIVTHLQNGEDVIRCAAAQALGALGDTKAAPALTDALLDEDPDVRADAMAALVTCGRVSDADTIRRSLMGDPVREVKVAAVQALCRLNDRASIPLLQALAKDRCNNDVAWDEADGPWDDWLDVQLAAVEALGDMAAVEAVQDLLDARADELGQDIDLAVFAALAKMPGPGIEALLALVKDGTPRERIRSLSALSKAVPDLFAPMIGDLVGEADPDVRGLAIPALDADSPHVKNLALDDPDPSVRSAAIYAFGASRHDLLQPALHDDSEEVRALALEAIAEHRVSLDMDDVSANITAWLQTAGTRLAVACVRMLQELGGTDAVAALCDVAGDTERSEEMRHAAICALGRDPTEEVLTVLTACAKNPSRQVRLAALSTLTDIVARAPAPLAEDARTILIEAMQGNLVGSHEASGRSGDDPQSDVGVSKVEDEGPGKIAITPDGDIVPAEDVGTRSEADDSAREAAPENAFPMSTLDAIQAPATALSEADEDPLSQDDLDRLVEGRPKPRRKRVAVDGPDDFAEDLRIVAIRTAADCPGAEIDLALADLADTSAPTVSLAVLEAAAQRSQHMELGEPLKDKVAQRLGDPDALIRGAAARAVGNDTQGERDLLSPHLNDADPVIRAIALTALAPVRADAVIAGLDDPAPVVRRAAMDFILSPGGETQLEEAIRTCLEANQTDCLAQACKHSTRAREILTSALTSQDMTWFQTQGVLEALSSSTATDQGPSRAGLV